MTTSVSYFQRNVNVDAILYKGSQTTYVSRIVRAALKKVLGRDFNNYEITNGDDTVRIKGEGPYSKSKLFDIVRQAMLKRIKKPYSKFRTEVKSPVKIETDLN